MTGIVLMTALPPTEGHLALCRFAAIHAKSVGQQVLVLMCVLPDEPPGRGEHRDALAEALSEYSNVRVEIQFSNDPQGPKDENDDAFWAHWVRIVTKQSGSIVSYVYSSEPYGYRLAEALGAQHVPFSPSRSISHAKATDVRNRLADEFHSVIKPLRDKLRRRVVLFGQESVGKSTLARALAGWYSSVHCPEWARTYQEGIANAVVTNDVMDAIAYGQHAQEVAAEKMAEEAGCPFLFMDTDLLSTIGYDQYFFSKRRQDHDDRFRERQFFLEANFSPADLYLVCAPFDDKVEADPLRQGFRGERETSMRFWINMLEARGRKYMIIDQTAQDDRFQQAKRFAMEALETRAGFCGYRRS